MTEEKTPYQIHDPGATRPCAACGQPVNMAADAFLFDTGKVRHITCPARAALADALPLAHAPAATPDESYTPAPPDESYTPAPSVQFRTVAEAAALLRCHADTIRNRIAEGKLHAYRMPGGKQVLVKEAELLSMLQEVRPQ